MKKIFYFILFINLLLANNNLFYKGMNRFFNKDYKKALYYFKKSCDLNNSKACFMTAVMYAKHKGVKKRY